jgi:CheY-like chemotaxis protein
MDEATRLHLFEPFYTTKAIGKGTGLGLAAVYGAVRNHHGALRIDSAPGRGTTIAAYLPESGDDDTPAEPGPPVPTVRPGRILVVDDEEVVRHLATEQLRTAGHQVIPCADGLEAIRLVEQGGDGTDLVLLDLVMPGMSGGDTFHALRALRPGIRVLLASGYSVNDEAQALLGLGACGFVQKPFRAEALLRAVADALRTDRDAS